MIVFEELTYKKVIKPANRNIFVSEDVRGEIQMIPESVNKK